MSVIFSLSFRNLSRNKFRTLLTALAVVVLVCVFTFVEATLAYVESMVVSEASQTRLLVTERWVAPSRFPARYVSELAALPGVEDWTVWNGALGYFDESRQIDKRVLGLATRADNIVEMHPDLVLSPEELEAFQTQKDACLLGQATLDKMGWKVGQRFTLIPADIRRGPVDLTIVGVIPPSRWEGNLFLRNDYFMEVTGIDDFVNWVWLRAATPEAANEVVRELQEQFGNRTPALKAETESSGVARIASRNQSALALVQVVAYVLLVDITLILANSMNIAARERQREVAVLKILGFTPMSIMLMVTFEAVVIGAAGGLAGALSAYGIAEAMGGLSLKSDFFVSNIRIPEQMILTSPLIGALIGFVGSVYPAWTACRVKPTEVFVNVT